MGPGLGYAPAMAWRGSARMRASASAMVAARVSGVVSDWCPAVASGPVLVAEGLGVVREGLGMVWPVASF